MREENCIHGNRPCDGEQCHECDLDNMAMQYEKEKEELKARLSHLMDVAGKLFKSLELMLEDAQELRVIKARDLGEERDRRIHATYYEDIEEAKLALAEWYGIKDGGK